MQYKLRDIRPGVIIRITTGKLKGKLAAVLDEPTTNTVRVLCLGRKFINILDNETGVEFANA